MRIHGLLAVVAIFGLGSIGCDDDTEVFPNVDMAVPSSPDLALPDIDGGTYIAPLQVTGTVVDFESDAPVSGTPTVATTGLNPPPMVTMAGADFTLADIPPFSAFQILAANPTTHRGTYNFPIRVEGSNLSGIKASTVAESFLSAAATAFSVTPSAGKGIVFARLVDATTGTPKAGVPASALQLKAAAPPVAPMFLDDAKMPSVALSSTSNSGWVIFYDVDPGLVTVDAAMASGYTFASPNSLVADGTVTLIEVAVTTGMVATPTNVSFSTDVIPIFTALGCVVCHSGNGPGKDQGGLQLNGGAAKIHSELTVEISANKGVARVDTVTPDKSLVLTMPSPEVPPDSHPNAIFAGPTDPDYVKILVWIKEGALNN